MKLNSIIIREININIRERKIEGEEAGRYFTISSKSCQCLVLKYFHLGYLRIEINEEMVLDGLQRARL